MVKKKIIQAISYGLGAILLLIPMVSLVTATSERQVGNQGVGTIQGVGSSQAGSTCAQTYVVQRDDTLSAIALKYLGNLFAYNLIFQATNAVAGTDGFTSIRDPNIIEPGQVLCIPASPVAGSATAGTVVVTGTGHITSAETELASPTYNLTPEQGVLLVDNRAGNDIIFDLTRPLPGSAWVAPNHLQPFIVPAGLQEYMAHHPIGAFSIAPGEVQVTVGHITRLICFREVCQIEALVQPSAQSQTPPFQQLNQPVVAGQPPPTPVPKDNIDNDNIDNSSNGNDNNGNDNSDNDNTDNDNTDNDNTDNDNTDNDNTDNDNN